jgi:RNA polymerase sigma-70 factor (ECF subfamily)
VNEAHNRRRWSFRHKKNEVCWDEGAIDEAPRERSVPDLEPSPFDRALTREKHALIEQALTRTNPYFREAVVLRDIEDLNYDEIAEVLNISIGTVKSRITRGRAALRQLLTETLGPEPSNISLCGRRT